MAWVKFHEELTRGEKRGLPRAVRFVFMELSLLARPERGVVRLPRGMADLDAVHDLLGGSRKEVADAIKLLLDEGMILFEGEASARRLVIPSWATWNRIDDSGDRVKRHRSKDETPVSRSGNGDVTRYKTVSPDVGNESVTLLDKRREEKKRSEPPNPLPGDGAVAPDSGGQQEPAEPENSAAAAAAKRVFARYLAGWERVIGKGKKPILDAKRRRLVAARLRDGHSVGDLEQACDGLWASKWHVEQGRTAFDLALRDTAQIERFVAETAPKAKPQQLPRSQHSVLPDLPTPGEDPEVIAGLDRLRAQQAANAGQPPRTPREAFAARLATRTAASAQNSAPSSGPVDLRALVSGIGLAGGGAS